MVVDILHVPFRSSGPLGKLLTAILDGQDQFGEAQIEKQIHAAVIEEAHRPWNAYPIGGSKRSISHPIHAWHSSVGTLQDMFVEVMRTPETTAGSTMLTIHRQHPRSMRRKPPAGEFHRLDKDQD
jgi:hypothetical protein